MRAVFIAMYRIKADRLVKRPGVAVVRSKMNPLEYSARVHHELLNDRRTHAAAPISQCYVQAPNASDCSASRKWVEIQAADPTNAIASPRNVSFLSGPRETIAPIQPLIYEARNHKAPVRPGISVQLGQLRDLDQGLDAEFDWSHNGAFQRPRAAV
jgi:hypothetical protein